VNLILLVNKMRKTAIFIIIASLVLMLVFGIAYYHPITDNVVDSGGFWAYMYGMMSVPWALYSAGVVFFMGLTVFFATMEQKAQRY
jgi:hypothetical protein